MLDKCVRVYDCQSSEQLAILKDGFDGCVNGVSVTNLGGKTILASSTGSRCFPTETDYDEHSENGDKEQTDSTIGAASKSTVSIHELPNFENGED